MRHSLQAAFKHTAMIDEEYPRGGYSHTLPIRVCAMVDTKRERQKARALATPTPIDPAYVCSSCHRMCRSRIGLQSHRRKCLKK